MKGRNAAYWTCQVLGWGAYSAIALWATARQIGWRPSLVTGYLLYFFYSIALTHLLRREIQRRQWLGLPLSRALPRLAGASVLVGTVQTFLVVAVSRALEGQLGVLGQLRNVLGALGGINSVTAGWTVLYVAITSTRRYREARHHTLQLQLALREAELRALEAQVNPHFLFNCLNAIRGLITEDAARAQDMITRLANILRYNLQRDRPHTVPLAKEVEIVSDYLALEKIRFEDRLRVQLDISPAAAEVPVPAMLLQTLVENALKHGLADLPLGGELSVRAAVGPEGLVIEVENSGELAEPRPDSTQVGLSNARERLRVLYGGRASLQLAKREGGRVAATVLIPRMA
jgi:LytS/YehU family sensor histidine kinase